MPDSTPSWPTPGATPPSGDAPTQPAAPPPGDSPTQPVVPPTEAAPTVPGGPPPSPPPSVPAPGGPATPSGKRGGIPMPAFIVVLVLLVAALAFGIVSFLGKNSESDDKEKAQEELAQVRSELDQTRSDLASLQDELEGSQQTGEALGDLVGQAATVVDALKACTDSVTVVRVGVHRRRARHPGGRHHPAGAERRRRQLRLALRDVRRELRRAHRHLQRDQLVELRRASRRSSSAVSSMRRTGVSSSSRWNAASTISPTNSVCSPRSTACRTSQSR